MLISDNRGLTLANQTYKVHTICRTKYFRQSSGRIKLVG